MSRRELIDSICAAMPGAEASDPAAGDLDSWKVGGKMFATMGTRDAGVSVKTPSVEVASMLIEAGVGVKAPYFHRSWIRIMEDTGEDELRHRIEVSYDIVFKSLPKKVRDSIG